MITQEIQIQLSNYSGTVYNVGIFPLSNQATKWWKLKSLTTR